MKRYRLVVEAYEGKMPGAWGVRLGQQLPGGQLRWICDWIPAHAISNQTLSEQCQLIEDAWESLIYRIAGIQEALF